jgi:uncharacterized protein YkwD
MAAVLTATPAGANTAENHLFARLNHARTTHSRPALTRRADLGEVARAQARRMAASRTLYHNPNLTTEVRNWRWVGENVGYAPDIATVHAAFMASPHHRANILDRDYTQVGVGVVTRDGRVWVAEVFRRPLRTTFQADAKGWAGHGNVGPLTWARPF